MTARIFLVLFAFVLLFQTQSFANSCGNNLVTENGEQPPQPPNSTDASQRDWGNPYELSYPELIKHSLNGTCLKTDPKARYNFYKWVSIVLGSQIVSYLDYLRNYDKKTESSTAYTTEIPIGILLNTYLIMSVQAEVGCRILKKPEMSYAMNPKAIWDRYRSFAKLTPLAAITAASSITLQKLAHKMADEFSENHFGKDLGKYQDPLSWKFGTTVARDTAAIMAFELLYLFPRWTAYENYLMNRGFPFLNEKALALGSRYLGSSGLLKYAPTLATKGVEWTYRLGFAIKIDTPFLLELMERDGFSAGELPLIGTHLPEQTRSFVFWDPDKWAIDAYEYLKNNSFGDLITAEEKVEEKGVEK